MIGRESCPSAVSSVIFRWISILQPYIAGKIISNYMMNFLIQNFRHRWWWPEKMGNTHFWKSDGNPKDWLRLVDHWTGCECFRVCSHPNSLFPVDLLPCPAQKTEATKPGRTGDLQISQEEQRDQGTERSGFDWFFAKDIMSASQKKRTYSIWVQKPAIYGDFKGWLLGDHIILNT